jgi:hypothetical protein
MPGIPRLRSTAPMLVALLALFVALGGPAEAKRLLGRGSVTSREVKDRSLTVRDLSRPAVRTLRATPPASITEAHLRNGAVTPGKLAPGAVSSPAIADRGVGPIDLAIGSVSGATVADGSLTSADVGRWSGRFSVDMPVVQPGQCWSREPVLQALDAAGADIRGDVVDVTPDASWPRMTVGGREVALSLTVYNSATPSRFVISACNPTATALPAAPARIGFAYVVIDVP